ncbi:carbohydrate ABC transporter permease [Paenibacillus sp. TAF58]
MKTKGMNHFYPIWLVTPALLIYAMFFLLPNVTSLFMGFTDWSIFDFYNIHFNGLKNFKQLFNETAFVIAIKNTFYFTIVTVFMKVVLGILFALLGNVKSKMQNFIRSVVFLPVMISTIVVAVIFSSIYNPTQGILNVGLRHIGLDGLAQEWLFDMRFAMTAISVMEIWQWVGFGMLVFLAGLQGVSKDYYEAAKIDGANAVHQFYNITLPLIMPSINIVLTFSIISGLKVFPQVYALTDGGPAGATQVIGTYLYKTFADGYLGYSSAVGFVFTVTVMTITFACLYFLRKREVEM